MGIVRKRRKDTDGTCSGPGVPVTTNQTCSDDGESRTRPIERAAGTPVARLPTALGNNRSDHGSSIPRVIYSIFFNKQLQGCVCVHESRCSTPVQFTAISELLCNCNRIQLKNLWDTSAVAASRDCSPLITYMALVAFGKGKPPMR